MAASRATTAGDVNVLVTVPGLGRKGDAVIGTAGTPAGAWSRAARTATACPVPLRAIPAGTCLVRHAYTASTGCATVHSGCTDTDGVPAATPDGWASARTGAPLVCRGPGGSGVRDSRSRASRSACCLVIVTGPCVVAAVPASPPPPPLPLPRPAGPPVCTGP